MIAKMCDWYYVDPNWLLMGRGNKIFRPDAVREPYFIEDDNNLDRKWHDGESPEKVNPTQTARPDTARLIAENNLLRDQAREKDITIREQAKELGRMEARINSLEQRLEKTAGGANIGNTANVG